MNRQGRFVYQFILSMLIFIGVFAFSREIDSVDRPHPDDRSIAARNTPLAMELALPAGNLVASVRPEPSATKGTCRFNYLCCYEPWGNNNYCCKWIVFDECYQKDARCVPWCPPIEP